ncbi:MAG: glycosyl hydrolase family 18 protein [Synechococcus sp. ChSW.bin.154]
MADFLGGGVTYQVNPAGSDITNFDPTSDRLDFGEISVHGLILGALPDGTAAIVNPWADPVQTQSLKGLAWKDLSLENFGVVGNEHLRQDIGAVLSWEQGLDARESGTVYVRSHQFGVQEVVNDFDPKTQKLSFLYLGTRERFSVLDTDEGVLISVEPSGQSVLLSGVQRTDLIGANLEFHHDQVMEDNLEVPFGFKAEQVSLVSRSGLLTPEAPAGHSTDGEQVRAGQLVNPDSMVTAIVPSPAIHDHSIHGDVMAGGEMAIEGFASMDAPVDSLSLSSAGLEASVAGTLYWGGMSGTLTLSNDSDVELKNWSFSFVTDQPNVQIWSAESTVTDLGDGSYQVSLTPPAWGLEIAAGGSIDLSFNASSVGLSNSGELTNEMFFLDVPVAETVDNEQLDGSNTSAQLMGEDTGAALSAVESEVDSLINTAFVQEQESESVEQTSNVAVETSAGLVVEATISGGWSGTFAGDVTVTNTSTTSVGTDWSVAFVMDAPFSSVSNFEVKSVLRGDGKYDVTLMPKSWAASLGAGASQSSYYQAAGDATDPQKVFDFGGLVAAIGVVEESSDSLASLETSGANSDSTAINSADSSGDGADSPMDFIDSTDLVDPVDLALKTNLDVVAGGAFKVDYQAPDGISEKRIVTYFEEWGVYERDVNLSDVNGQAMTHLNYSFFDVKADGSVQLFDSYAAQEKRFNADDQVSRTFSKAEYQAVDTALIAAYNSDLYAITETVDSVTVTSVPVGWNDAGPQDAGNFEQLRRFKELNPSVNLGFALGGWTLSDEFSTAFSSQAGRDRFVSDVVDIFQTYEFFNTVDFDWEYPGGGGDLGNASSSNDGANFALVLEQLRGELDALESQTGGDYEVSIATAGGSEKLANLNLPGIDSYVDFYNVMTYDFHGGWESQTGHQAAMTGDSNNYDITTAVSVFEEAGVDLSKLVMGAPAYTRAWGGVEDGGTFGYQQSGTGAEAEGSFEAGVYDYKDIVTDVITGQTDLYWDDDNKAAFVYNGDEWSSIETTATIAGKAAYVQEKDLGGMMFWALSNDAEGELSLVETADDILRQGVSYSEAVKNAPEFDYILGGNGEFSISDFTALA